MEEDQFVIHLSDCERCGCKSFERLRTHSYCSNCNYSPTLDTSREVYDVVPDWAIKALRGEPIAPVREARVA